jgi:1-acyl-sn-glycerol-3-phosphate acyltransferase
MPARFMKLHGSVGNPALQHARVRWGLCGEELQLARLIGLFMRRVRVIFIDRPSHMLRAQQKHLDRSSPRKRPPLSQDDD